MRRVGVAVLAVCALLLTGMLSPSAASWTDAEHATGAFTATVVPQPQVVGCQVNSVLGLLNSVSVDFIPPAGYGSGDIAWGVGDTPADLEAGTPAISNQGGGVFRATFTSNLLANLLGVLVGALLGTEFYIGGHTDGGWTSETVLTHFEIAILGLGSSCTTNVSG